MKKKLVAMLGLLGSILFILLSFPINSWGQEKEMHLSKQKVSIEWSNGKPSGTIMVLNGSLTNIKILKGSGKVKDNRFEFTSSGSARIALEIVNAQNHSGLGATIISVKTNNTPFSFFF